MLTFFEWIDKETRKQIAHGAKTIDRVEPMLCRYYTKINSGNFMYNWPLPNVWLGVTAENQEQAARRIPLLLLTPAAKRFVSIEPMLGPIDLTELSTPNIRFAALTLNALAGHYYIPYGAFGEDSGAHLDWVIVGGESGPKARALHPDWVRSLRGQCQRAGTPFFFKQWGEWAPDCLCGQPEPCRTTPRPEPGKMGVMFRCGKKRAGSLLDSKEHKEIPVIQSKQPKTIGTT